MPFFIGSDLFSTHAIACTDREVTIIATRREPQVQDTLSFRILGVVGEGESVTDWSGRLCFIGLATGAFGVVTKLQLTSAPFKGQTLALKRVFQDPKYKVPPFECACTQPLKSPRVYAES